MSARSDSWYATLQEDQLWQLYAIAKRGAQWYDVAKIAEDQFGLTVTPSRSGFYRWLDFMRGQESERRLAQARIAALEADGLAKTVGLKDETAIRAYKSLAAEMALKSDAKTAGQFMRLAMDLTDRQLHAAEIELKTQDLARKDEELKISQEKLRIEQAKNAKAVEAVSDVKLTDEQRVAKVKQIFGI